MAARRRLDAELVRRGSPRAEPRPGNSSSAARSPSVVLRPQADPLVDPGEAVEVAGDGPRVVSRGGEKLDAALDHFGVDPAGRRVIDIGSSTGGFTDCVLQRGATRVVAIDVGRNQLHEKIRADDRVDVHEQTNVRHTDPADFGGLAISSSPTSRSSRCASSPLTSSPSLRRCRSGDSGEASVRGGKAEADKARGVIRDPEVWRRTLDDATTALSAAGAAIMGVMVSPITGGDGNVEFLVHARAGAPDVDPVSWAQWRDAAVAAGEGR